MKLKDPKKPSGPVKVGKLEIQVDRDLCIGAATCIAVASKTFALDSEAKSVIVDSSDEETVDAIIEAAKSCPTGAITIKNEKGEQIFPK